MLVNLLFTGFSESNYKESKKASAIIAKHGMTYIRRSLPVIPLAYTWFYTPHPFPDPPNSFPHEDLLVTALTADPNV